MRYAEHDFQHPDEREMSKHVVITVFGSLGDLHPLMAVGMGLRQRGHRVTLATSEHYRPKIEAEGLHFHHLRPEPEFDNPQVYEELFHPARGPETLMRKYLIPHVRQTAEDLRPLLESADFLLNSPLIMPGPLLAEHLKLPWAGVALQPMLLFSAYEPPVLPPAPFLQHFYGLGPLVWTPMLKLIQGTTDGWSGEVHALREELGVPDRGNPIFAGQFSPHLNLAIFSGLLGEAQPDWPPHTHVTGFAFYDRMHPEESGLPEAIRNFLDQGDPPVVFTLGSSAVRTAGAFYEVSLEAVRRLGCRAILLAGENRSAGPVPENILVWDYASYSQLFPYARAVVHQGGSGTTAQTLRAGKPMVVVPYGFDQPDNAVRMRRLGVGRIIPRDRYQPDRVVRELGKVLENPAYAEQSRKAGERICREDGVRTSCDLIERFL